MHITEQVPTIENGASADSSTHPQESRNGHAPHVCIVGAGISGLRCAEHLIPRGVDVTIIEARDRIGGRIHQSNKLGYPADLGPNWIHTSGENPLLHLANRTNTPLHVWNDGVRLFDWDGNLIEASKAQRLSDLRWTIIDESFKYSSQHGPEIPASQSLYDFFVNRVAQLDLAEEDREILIGMCQMWGDYTGDPIQRQSLKYVWLEEVCGGEECIVTSSFEAILAKIAEIPLRRAKIQFNTRATSFKSLLGSHGRSMVEVGTLDGETQIFDEVVVTTPLGWLKSHKSAFKPSIDDGLSRSIDAISIGHLEKESILAFFAVYFLLTKAIQVYITFPSAFWRKAIPGEKDPPSDIPEYTNWISPTYDPSRNPNHWPQEAYDLGAFAAPYTRPTLLLYLFGDLSAHISSIIHHSPNEAKQHALLDAFFKPYYTLLPNYSADDPECSPKAYLGTAWRYDELAGNGSYCNLQVGIDDADKHIETIQRGMPERGIWFAGEHASPFEELGTAAGAYMSGERVAGKILDKYGLGKAEI